MKRNSIRKMILSLISVASISGGLTSCNSLTVSNDVLVIGMEANYQPFNWTASKESEYTLPIYGTNEYADGYDIQIAKYLSKDLNKEVYIKRMTWDSLIPSLESNDINMVLAGMTDTSERRKSIDFTIPYLSSDLTFLIKTENMPSGYGTKENPATYEQLLELFKGKSLICQASVVGDDFIDTYFKNVDSSIKHNSPLATYPLAAQDVKSGNSFAMPAEAPVCEAMCNLGGLSVVYCDYSFLSEEDQNGLSVSIGIKKGNSELKELLNTSLAKLLDSEKSALMGAAAQRSADNA